MSLVNQYINDNYVQVALSASTMSLSFSIPQISPLYSRGSTSIHDVSCLLYAIMM